MSCIVKKAIFVLMMTVGQITNWTGFDLVP